ncbi:hypothetical protein AAC387_Pa08g1191 [Persea americana]
MVEESGDELPPASPPPPWGEGEGIHLLLQTMVEQQRAMKPARMRAKRRCNPNLESHGETSTTSSGYPSGSKYSPGRVTLTPFMKSSGKEEQLSLLAVNIRYGADEWVVYTKNVYETLQCTGWQKVALVASMFKDIADFWWKTVRPSNRRMVEDVASNTFKT